MMLREYMRLAYPDRLKARFLHVAPRTYRLLQAHQKPSRDVQRKVGRMKALPDEAVVAGLARLLAQDLARHEHPKRTSRPPFVLDHWPEGHVVAPLLVPPGRPALYVSAAAAPSGDLVVAAVLVRPGDRALNLLNRRLYGRHWRDHGLVVPRLLPQTALWPLAQALIRRQDPPAPVIIFKHAAFERASWQPYLETLLQALGQQRGRLNVYVEVPAKLRRDQRRVRAELAALADRRCQPHPVVAAVERQNSLGLQAAHLVAYAVATLAKEQTKSPRLQRLYRDLRPAPAV